MSAREAILRRVRAGGADGAPAEIAAEARALVAERGAVQPPLGTDDLIARFTGKAQSERVTARVARLGEMAEVPAALRRYCAEAGLAARVALQPDAALTGLDWAGVEVHHDAAPDETLGLTRAVAGIAETGSVAFLSGRQAPILLNYLPLHHVVVLEAGGIVPHLEDLWDRLGGRVPHATRSVNIVTGTSGTADIEAKNIRGAHGPKFMQILLIG